MAYPFLSLIIAAISRNEFEFQHLRGVKFERDECGELARVEHGNFALIFRVRYRGRRCALRCYHADHDNLDVIYGDRYFPRELSIETDLGNELLDVVLVDWIEGVTLLSKVEELRDVVDEEARIGFQSLSKEFDLMACRLLNEEWAHGDLSDTNIIVGRGGKMHLIDLDTIYTPQLKGYISHDMGTPAFQSPLRCESTYGESMDHFSIALISSALRALSLAPSLMREYPDRDALLINGASVLNPQYELLDRVCDLFAERGCSVHYRLAKSLKQGAVHIEQLKEILGYLAQMEKSPKAQREEPQLELYNDKWLWGYRNRESGESIISAIFDEACEYRLFRNHKKPRAYVRIGEFWHSIDVQGNNTDK